jgi:NAD(P)-dependent dehydrogenase (short-subunit alcohol dehydrogenase family)
VESIKSIGGDAVAIKGDVTSTSDVNHLFDEAKRIFGRIDIVIANSGIPTSIIAE